jgi:hypothetical protein
MITQAHVYSTTPVTNWHLKKIDPEYIKIYYDFNEFLEFESNNKHAVFHAEFPYESNPTSEFDTTVKMLLDRCQSIIILVSEVHTPIVDFIKRFQHPKIKPLICGFVEGVATEQWMDWFITTSSHYKNNSLLDQLLPYNPKPKYFDILLGQPKPHRNCVYDFINAHNLNDQVVMTYLLKHNDVSIRDHGSNGFIFPDGDLTCPNSDFRWTVTPVAYHGRQMSLSQVVPTNIYNETAYSIVTETNSENHYTFYTEKTVKPILARRLFITLAGQYHLRNLRRLGFKTFDGIIDESYDAEPANYQRWSMAIEQMRYLFSQPQEKILQQIKPIVEHNYNVMLETNWLDNLTDAIRNYILNQPNS